MSITATCIAARNLLRTNLTNFFDNEDEDIQTERRKASCKLMPDDRPAPNSGREFISLYCSAWNPIDGDALYAFHEEFEITVAVTTRIGDIPFDRIGEAGIYKDEDIFVQQTYSAEERIREIVTIIHPNYVEFAAELNALIGTRQKAYDKLWFIGADSKPAIVGPDHFHAESDSKHPSGLLWKARFKGAGRLHWMTTIDEE